MTTIILTAAAFVAIVPAALLLFLLLDRYAVPRVPVSVFEEYKVLVAFIVGIPGGLPLALVFLFYTSSLESYDGLSSLIYLLFFVAVANLSRIVFLRFRTFSGDDRKGKIAVFYALAFGCGSAVSILLGAANSALTTSSDLGTVGLVTLLSCDMVLLEGWGGMRFASAHARHGSIFPVLLVEALALVAVSPLYFGLPYLNVASLAALLIALVLLTIRDEQAILRPFLRGGPKMVAEKPFGRVDGE